MQNRRRGGGGGGQGNNTALKKYGGGSLSDYINTFCIVLYCIVLYSASPYLKGTISKFSTPCHNNVPNGVASTPFYLHF